LTVTRARVALLIIAIAVVTAGAFGADAVQRVGVHRGFAPEQPIAFSHKLHAGESQIPCLYCHFAATRSRHAGIPPLNVCMNCHAILQKRTRDIERLKESVQQRRPIAWTKVHSLPDFVYFNHGQHLLGGVACRECHGAVESMDRVRQEAPLTMGWCIDCHRQRAAAHAGSTPSTDCGRCHY
jgi:Cytochrome c7 and related cytochrome c